VATLALAVVALALFALHCARARNPLIDRELFRLRPLTGASVVSLFFMAAFGGMLLSRVLWAQEVWHWSALSTGLAIAPGPLMVPLFSCLVAGRLIDRFGPGPVIAAGCTLFAAGLVWWALAMGLTPDYAGEMLGGMLLTGIGVGLTLPTFMATGAAALPAHSFATGSAVINMLRQIGLAIGVAILIAVLGTPRGPSATLAVYQRASWILAAISFAAGVVGLALLADRHRAATGDSAGAPAYAPSQ
jgi:MFS family permease